MIDVRAKKHLGQHFLKDENIAAKIAGSLSPDAMNVLEIGPGTGVLTKYLIGKPTKSFKLIEIDRESISFLRNNYPELGDNLIEGDFLRINLQSIFTEPYSIIGNFPYNISSQIFFKILEHREQVIEVVGMIQQEVAQRMAAKEGSKTYGILSVLLQAWYDIEYLFFVPASVFIPPPKVTSAVIRLRRNQVHELGCDPVLFTRVVKTAFNQRRKTLHNALKPIASYQGRYSGKRAEQLSVADFIELTSEIAALPS